MKTNRETNPKSYRETDRETNPEANRETDRETKAFSKHRAALPRNMPA